MTISIKCPAKLNLFLKVNNLRADNYHELQSIFCKINIYDEIAIEQNHQFEVITSGKACDINFSNKLNKNNIICDIYNYFLQNFKISSAIKIFLTKNIPIGAGLGGGSSDGANFIKILNQFYNLKLSKSQMQKIASIFGSDLPFFFEDDICLVEGRGEIIHQFKNIFQGNLQSNYEVLKNLKILLIYPNLNLSTIEVFKLYKNRIKENFQKYSPKIEINNFSYQRLVEDIICQNNNDLEPSAFQIHPPLAQIKSNLEKFSPLSAKMTGSGSAFFAIFPDSINYQKCLDFFYQNFPDFYIKPDLEIIF